MIAPADRLPRADLPPWNRALRYYVSRLAIGLLMRLLFRLRVEGRANIPAGPALLCFSHASWLDPFLLYATLPLRPRLFFFGPKEENLRVGARNRLMYWTATPVPFKPAKTDLLDTARRVQAVFDAGGVLAIAGEGRIHVGERTLLPLQDGAAYFALRAHVPIVPVGLNGLTWLGFRRRLRVRIGAPISTAGRPTAATIEDLTVRTRAALLELVSDAPDLVPPGPFGRWLTELFNDWPEGSRDAAVAATRANDPGGSDGPSGILSSNVRQPGAGERGGQFGDDGPVGRSEGVPGAADGAG